MAEQSFFKFPAGLLANGCDAGIWLPQFCLTDLPFRTGVLQLVCSILTSIPILTSWIHMRK